jgi:hypothetical protein
MARPNKKGRGLAASPITDHTLSCPSGKKTFESRQAAKKHLRHHPSKQAMQVYRCRIPGCAGWHMTSQEQRPHG